MSLQPYAAFSLSAKLCQTYLPETGPMSAPQEGSLTDGVAATHLAERLMWPQQLMNSAKKNATHATVSIGHEYLMCDSATGVKYISNILEKKPNGLSISAIS